MANDSDDFNRYEAGQRLATIQLEKLITQYKNNETLSVDEGVLKAFEALLKDENVDEAFKAEAISLPTVTTLVEAMDVCDYEAAFTAREFLKREIAKSCISIFKSLYVKCDLAKEFSVDPAEVGRRSLKNTCLVYISLVDGNENTELAFEQFSKASNMTDEISALSVLSHLDIEYSDKAIQQFYEKWNGDVLVMNKWFAVQASSHKPQVLYRVKELEKSPAYDSQNPNKIRSLIGAFVGNVQYHSADGSGYSYLADKIIEIDGFNPSMSSGLARCFRKYAKMDESRKELMRVQMERILAVKDLSKDTFEIISKTLNK